MNHIEELLQAVDARWVPPAGSARIVLRVLGQSALFLQTGYERGTRDGDILETQEVCGAVGRQLEALAGQGTELAIRHGIYLDIVGDQIPLLPHDPTWNPTGMRLQHFDVVVLDIPDVLVSKLYRYIRTDLDDIRAMIEGGFVSHTALRARFEAVIDRHQFQSRADRLPKMVERFNTIERDLFVTAETTFVLHSSVYR